MCHDSWAVRVVGLSVLVFYGCVDNERGCGGEPLTIGPSGGGAATTNEECPESVATVSIAPGTFDREYEVTVLCLETTTPPPDGLRATGPEFVFGPAEAVLDLPAHFRIGSEEANVIGWRMEAQDSEWNLLSVPLTDSYVRGFSAVAFDYDRFGHFIVLGNE